MNQKEREQQVDYKACGNEFENKHINGVCYTTCLTCKESFLFSVEEFDKHLLLDNKD